MDESTEVRTDGNSLLKAVYLGRLRLTRLLLEGGAYINESNEHGETPLMVACKTKHWDSLSVPKHKMVRYLLENGADPNIQDKTGKTALMHACQDEAGAQTLPVLLSRGADPTLQDHAGSSSLVYALNSDNADVLAILLDACKAKGKEVIFIATSKLPGGQQTTKQYLNVPPLPDLQESAPGADSQLRAPPPPQGSATRPGSPLLGLRGPHGARTTSPVQPPSPLRVPGPDRHPYLHRINSEQWAKGAQTPFPAEDPDRGGAEEEPGLRVGGGPAFSRRPPAVSRHHSMDVKDSAGLLRALENASGTHGQRARRGLLGRKMSYDGAAAAAAAAASLHSASHPNLHQDDGAPFARRSPPADHDPGDCLGQLSSLQNVVRWRNLGMDHYSSDSQLPQFGASRAGCGAAGAAAAAGGHKAAAAAAGAGARGATASGSRDSPEAFGRRQGAPWMERRGSGALLLDHIAHTRPGCLPPLNPHTPIPHIGISPSLSFPLGGSSKTLNGAPSGSKPPQPPCFPKEPKDKRVLWRRHSMQSEQLAQLVDFQDVCRR